MTQNVRRAVVTAGTAGLGFETARALVRAAYEVTVIGRNAERGRRAVDTLRAESAGGEVRFLPADLSSLAEVRDVGRTIAAAGPLHLLVNNVGGMYVDRWESVDGIEGAFVLNHLTPYLLTDALTDSLAAGAAESGEPSRVVQVTSSAMVAAVPDFTDVDLPGEYYGLAVTGRAKLANLTWALDVAGPLAERGITLVVADPGPAATPNAAAMEQRMLPPAMRGMWDAILEGVKRPADEAVRSIVRAATAPELTAGTIVEPDGGSGEGLRAAVTPELTAAVRALTDRTLGSSSLRAGGVA
ncbi:SDR family NAD(P)-dependent oxidoreductase [Cryptosporangium aurantiacum]|uniref:Short-chain dehydrogenase n=1 Tax=Cryptosporangium aurantiacum TaxID=134849 RepID=A0A1M7TY90_9ACTN|nr:SDR family NAD(P)-dependent oxidoreductase [Cryptosporangium aurantiacum]SHN75701.1 Short-chain dehydrogenase [Cryptosporangium aurantiacum]